MRNNKDRGDFCAHKKDRAKTQILRKMKLRALLNYALTV